MSRLTMAKADLRPAPRPSAMAATAQALRDRAATYRTKGYASLAAELEAEAVRVEAFDQVEEMSRPAARAISVDRPRPAAVVHLPSPATPTPPAVQGDRWLSIEHARQRMGVTRRTIYNWIAAGRVRYQRTAGGQIRIAEASLWRRPSE